ncbi:hypothetical protein C8F04DRAFT_1058627 [Mycena alexandri]|uniref:C2H2-type domain-containing protein n=1 Tax=Mycena alexandri TaxID=1745969 RepID=A0AAD6TL93_9AGAR|nr:hypothetical protein C8F04DRAFT_1058627 [Mycena alexandri]
MLVFAMNAGPSFHYSLRHSGSSTAKPANTLEYASLQQIYPMRPRHEYRAPDSHFPLRPVSPSSPPIRESSAAAVVRAHERADALNRAVDSASTKRTNESLGQPPYPVDSPRYLSRPRAQERFPAPPSLSMRHDPVLYAAYHRMPSPSADSDSEDSSEDERRGHSPCPSYRGRDERTPTREGSRPFKEPLPILYKREASVEISRLNTPPINRSVNIPDSRRRASPASSTSSEHPIFDIGLPPRQDHRSGYSSSVSRRTSPSTVHSGSDPTSPGNNKPPAPNRNWEDHAIQVRTPEGGVAYRCTWITDTGAQCPYETKKQLVKRHVETTHLKMKPYVCDICQKGFPQKTGLEIHHNGHTGDKPHKCNYNCGKTFKDPARRHRHHVDVHGYVPKQGKKKQLGPGSKGQEASPYESLPPLRMNSDTNSITSSRG